MNHEDTSGNLVDLIIPLLITLEYHLFQSELLLDTLIVSWVWVAKMGGSSVRAAFVMDAIPNNDVALITRDWIAKCESQAPLKALHKKG